MCCKRVGAKVMNRQLRGLCTRRLTKKCWSLGRDLHFGLIDVTFFWFSFGLFFVFVFVRLFPFRFFGVSLGGGSGVCVGEGKGLSLGRSS